MWETLRNQNIEYLSKYSIITIETFTNVSNVTNYRNPWDFNIKVLTDETVKTGKICRQSWLDNVILFSLGLRKSI